MILSDEIKESISRRPQTSDDLLGIFGKKAINAINILLEKGEIEEFTYSNERFFRIKKNDEQN